MFYLKKRGRRWNMKIAVEITIFGHHFTEVVEYPGVPRSHADVVRWLMSQTEFKWVDYEKSSRDDKLLYHLDDDVAH
jgi:hypothetical protein